MLKKAYNWLHRKTSQPKEEGAYSAGYWQDKTRKQALLLCSDAKGSILEIGCGEGLFLAQLAAQNPGSEIFGIDFDQARIRQAGERLDKQGIKNVHLSLQEATSLDFTDGRFNTVVCINVFFNMASLESVRQTLKEVRRITDAGGRVIFDFRNSLNPLLALKYSLARFYDETVAGLPLNTYRPGQISAVLNEQGFKIRRKSPIGKIWGCFAPIFVIEAVKE